MDCVTCPNCDARLCDSEQIDGWCETCGHALPPHISAAAAKHSRESRRRADHDPFARVETATATKASAWPWRW
jgi:hypothetical protein